MADGDAEPSASTAAYEDDAAAALGFPLAGQQPDFQARCPAVHAPRAARCVEVLTLRHAPCRAQHLLAAGPGDEEEGDADGLFPAVHARGGAGRGASRGAGRGAGRGRGRGAASGTLSVLYESDWTDVVTESGGQPQVLCPACKGQFSVPAAVKHAGSKTCANAAAKLQRLVRTARFCSG